MSVVRFKSYIRTTEMKSNEEWFSQFWTQFMQLRKKAGITPLKSWIFSAILRNCVWNCVHNCKNHSWFDFSHDFIYELFHLHLTIVHVRPRPNVELFMRRTKLSESRSWKVRRLAQLSSSEWVWIRRIEALKIACRTNVDLHMRQAKQISFVRLNCLLVWFSWLVRRVPSSTSDPITGFPHFKIQRRDGDKNVA